MLDRFFLDNTTYATFLSLDYGKSSGSGFRLIYKDATYLITAKHVLFDETDNLRGENLLIISQKSKGLLNEAQIMDVDMKAAIIYFSSTEDIAAIQLERKLENKSESSSRQEDIKFVLEKYVSIQQPAAGEVISINSSQTRNLNEIVTAHDVFLIGFPTSLVFQKTKYFDVNKPLLRKGIISGINLQDNTFIIDCSAYYGNSGATIFEVCEDEKLRVIGVVSKYIPFVTEWRNNREPSISHIEYANSGYSVCIPMDAIFQLLDKNYIEYLTLLKLGQ